MIYQLSTPYTEPIHPEAKLEIEHTDDDGITRRWRLPAVLCFGVHKYLWRPVAFRPPKHGERFVSGAIPETFVNHGPTMSSPYLIADIGDRVTTVSYYIPANDLPGEFRGGPIAVLDK
jgi:hypothetical protein